MKGKKNTDKLVTILPNMDFCWYSKEIERAVRLWEYGTGIKEMARILKRSCEEVFMLLMHLSLEGKITQREGYVWGRDNFK